MCTETSSWIVLQVTWGEATSWHVGQLCFISYIPIFVSFVFFLNLLMLFLTLWWWILAALEKHGISSPGIASYKVLLKVYILTISVDSFFFFCIFYFPLFLAPSLKYINVPRSPLSQIIFSLAKTLLFLTVTYHSSISWKSILSGFRLFLPFTRSSLSTIFWLLLLQN